ncbi:thioredoxin domain-containing protein [Deinococcus sp. SL84]|uniref:thioredoxin domain-containing protein n=1 Tax=Deinococcus sp. SL84 TaxID=2994663 RepID=UPI002272D9D8|nr:thioredoxin domain-containing protein [Deinococcus sp. SL84]MCY1702219.1 thioredoxin domain-containing protein [Deinococcus sp. SL84]
MKPHMFLLVAALLLPGAQAQLWNTPQATASQPLLRSFKAEGDVMTHGQTRAELDRIGQRVIGVYVRAPKANTEDVARAILSAWGAPEDAVPDLKGVLDDPGFQQQAQQLFEEVSEDGGSAVYVRLQDGTWQAYTALKVYPHSAFPASSAPLGNDGAPARLNIVSDYQCPYCNQLWNSASMAEWRSKPGVYRLNYHHFPLSFHPLALPAAQFSECAAQQGRFWEFSDAVNADFAHWTQQPEAEARQSFTRYAVSAGVTQAELDKCLAQDRSRDIMATADQLQRQLNVRGTPSVYLNGIKLNNYNDAAQIRAIRAVTEAGPGAEKVIEQRLKGLR